MPISWNVATAVEEPESSVVASHLEGMIQPKTLVR